jgi:hypothetical protein
VANSETVMDKVLGAGIEWFTGFEVAEPAQKLGAFVLDWCLGIDDSKPAPVPAWYQC